MTLDLTNQFRGWISLTTGFVAKDYFSPLAKLDHSTMSDDENEEENKGPSIGVSSIANISLQAQRPF